MSEVVIVKITDLSRAGSGVARLESGEVIFVPFTAPGDEVRVEITERKKNYLHGKIVEVVKPASIRVTPPCPVFTECGGCSWQHLPYSLQFETKKKGLLHALSKSGVDTAAIEIDSMPAKSEYHYRNRIQMRGLIEGQQFGFFAKGGKAVVPVETCAIADSRINDALPRLKKEGFAIHTEDFKMEAGLDDDSQLQVSWNKGHASLGFRQINDEQNVLLQEWVAQHLVDADTLLDLYGGGGNLSLSLKGRFKNIHCVDVRVPRDSGLAGYTYHKSSVAQWLHGFRNKAPSMSIILDPPREGLSHDFPKIAASLLKLPVTSMILVGCDVDSFVRDTQRLLKSGYHLKRLGVLDLFPQTPHVESLALFTR